MENTRSFFLIIILTVYNIMADMTFAQTYSTVVLRVIDQGNGFNDIRFKGEFSNWAVVEGYDDGLNGDTIAYDGVWTIVLDSLIGPSSYEWGAIDTDNGNGTVCDACDGSDGWGTWLLDIIGEPNQEFSIGDDGQISGSTSITIPSQGGEVTKTVLFSVDMTEWLDEEDATGLKVFSVSRGDQMQVRGGFNAWSCDDLANCRMTRTPGTNIFTLATSITGFPDTEMEYKYYLELDSLSIEILNDQYGELYDGIGWEDSPQFGGGNRKFMLGPEDGTGLVDLGIEGYYDLPAGGIIPDGQNITVSFTSNMEDALSQGFNPDEDTVYVSIQDRWLTYLQGLGDGYKAIASENVDGTYSVNLSFVGPFPWHMLYTWGYYDTSIGTYIQEGGGFLFGRSRARYQHANEDNNCEWGDYIFPIDYWQFEPPLFVEEYNPELICISLDIDKDITIDSFVLKNNYPNPFNPYTKIEYFLPVAIDVELIIYDMLGNVIKHLVRERKTVGYQSVIWDSKNSRGLTVSTGVYLYSIKAGNFSQTRKMVLLK
ncbi:MAG: hypothetical protein CMG55_06300 [Candidatus Marinimicrobia bacterium]|nr:hypothetical protein [Candidatus Neomarinimicrobiota bacterium]